MSDYSFSEEEVRQIIRQAMEAEKHENKPASDEHGISLNELISIGKDVGLSESEIRNAATQFIKNPLIRENSVSNTHILEKRVFKYSGDEDKLWIDLKREMIDYFGETSPLGVPSVNPYKKQWKHASAGGVITTADLEKNGEEYTFSLSQKVGNAHPVWEGVLWGLMIGILLFSITFAIFKPTGLINLFLGSGIWGLSSLSVYYLDIKWRKKKMKQLSVLTDEILNKADIGETEKNINEPEIEIDNEDYYQANDTDTSVHQKNRENS